MMFKWRCPYCGGNMYSAYSYFTEEKVKCIGCGKEFENKYFRKEKNYGYDTRKNNESVRKRRQDT